jgi:hypothetical protein
MTFHQALKQFEILFDNRQLEKLALLPVIPDSEDL